MPHPRFPDYPGETSGGDDVTHSPQKTTNSLLGSERGTQSTRRLETDSSRNLYVRIAGSDVGVVALATGSVTSVPASTLTTIVTYTAPSAKLVSRISVSGTIYAKFQLFKNTVLFDTYRSGPDRSVQLVFDAPLSLSSGDILDVKVTHFQTGLLENFESTVYGI